MAVGGGRAGPRIVPAVYIAGEAPADRIPPGSGPWILERRSGDGFQRVGIYGHFAEAMKALDEQVGLGHGTLHDYEMELIPKKAISTRKLVTKMVAWVFPISLIATCLALATVNIRAVAIAVGITALAGIGASIVQEMLHRP